MPIQMEGKKVKKTPPLQRNSKPPTIDLSVTRDKVLDDPFPLVFEKSVGVFLACCGCYVACYVACYGCHVVYCECVQLPGIWNHIDRKFLDDINLLWQINVSCGSVIVLGVHYRNATRCFLTSCHAIQYEEYIHQHVIRERAFLRSGLSISRVLFISYSQ